ncbi:DNA-binding GntR family transcriptional regulator [Actinoplanes lutulentus]|uniref:GntR family transcriptional regulator n=1 Tax=Actinoplanes lutulentus TaxID=1287878 RepID=A0A327ZB19_9ACTN|nr:GntR family transcriptional regulator [Actinoplanes lutulentus]MBB2947226.1 DNA-binding GntR family transcriptional regulator [Actinoplanes lutulentus]RAK36501.1 GntR family transcriptional regulator [Actinoplanes lutulentus]
MTTQWTAIGTVDRSLSTQVYDFLRERIISGDLKPGQRLIEREICEQLNVSRIPLREALPQLEADGFIRTLPRRGAMVTQLTLRDIEELFDVRESLEVLAAKLAAGNPDPAGLAVLAENIREARAALDRGADHEAAAANVAFHDGVLALSRNALLAGLMQPLNGRMQWLFRMTADRDIRVQCAEHEGLFAAIRDGNTELAASLAFAHVASGRTPSLTLLADVLPADR